MSDVIRPTPSRPLAATSRGTQPLSEAGLARPAAASQGDPASQASRTPRDQAAAMRSSQSLEEFVNQHDELAELRHQARGLLLQLSGEDRAKAEKLFEALSKPAPPQGKLEEFRHDLQQMLKRISLMVEKKRADQQHFETQAMIEWLIFYQSLERYIANLELGEKVESTFQERRLNEQQSKAEHAERLLVASQGQAPEHRFSLLSAHLGK